MTITLHSSGTKMILTREGARPLVHIVPRKNKFFKEELRLYRDEIRAWLKGEDCDVLIAYKPTHMSFYRNALYQAVATALQRHDKLVYLVCCTETANVVR